MLILLNRNLSILNVHPKEIWILFVKCSRNILSGFFILCHRKQEDFIASKAISHLSNVDNKKRMKLLRGQRNNIPSLLIFF